MEELRNAIKKDFYSIITNKPLKDNNLYALLSEFFKSNKIDTYQMEFILNMTSLRIRKNYNSMIQLKDENAIIDFISNCDQESIEYLAVQSYCMIK